MRYVMAFDVSKGSSIVAVYDELQTFILEDIIVHSRSGFESLQKKMDSLEEKYNQSPEIVFEATGVYSRALERFVRESGYKYYRLNPLEAKIQTTSLRRNKTDKSDAHELAKTHFKSNRYQTFSQDKYYSTMHAMTRHYDEMEQEKIKYKNKLHSLVHLSFPEMEDVFKTKSVLFYNIIQLFPHPDFVLRVSRTIIRNRIKNCTEKNYHRRSIEERADQLIHAAQDSFPAIQKTDYQCELIKGYAGRVLSLEEKQRDLIKEMASFSIDRREFRILLSFPGIGETTACRLIGEIGNLERFKSNKQLNAYVGIDIARYQSGSVQYKDHINKRGNRRLRSILYFMIISMLSAKGKKINHITDYYYKLKEQPYNKHHKVAVIACMNKFLKIAFHLIQHDIPYDYHTATSCA